MDHVLSLRSAICTTWALLLGIVGCGAKVANDDAVPSIDIGSGGDGAGSPSGGQSNNVAGASNASGGGISVAGAQSTAATGGRATGGASSKAQATGGRPANGTLTGGTSARATGGRSGVGGTTPNNTGTKTTSSGGSNAGGAPSAVGGTSSAAAGGTVGTGGVPSIGGALGAGGTKGTATTTGTVPTGTPTIGNNGFVTVNAGTTILSGYVSSYVGGSGSSISLTYDASSFCASGTVGANATYNSWAGVGFNVNQAQGGSSGSTGPLVLNGSTITINYENTGGSKLELQLWDGSEYWCYYLPAAKGPTATTVPLSSLNTQCWNNGGTAFTSGTPITTVQLVVPGSSTTPIPFDYCFLGMTVQ